MNTVQELRYKFPRLFWVAVCAIIATAGFLRVYQIELRPFHNDEGVNYHFVESMRNLGYYPYSHENYHGPIYFYAIALSTWLLDFSEMSMRLPSIIFGMLCLLLPLLLRKTEGDRFSLLAMAMIAVSCSQVFHSRYAIHEMLFLFGGALLGISFYLWFRMRSRFYLSLCGVGLGILIGTKETFIISGFCVFFAFWSLCLPGFVRGFIRCSKESPLKIIGEPGTVVRGMWHQRQSFLFGFLIAIIIVLVFFSGGFRWMGGLRELFLGVPQWIGRNHSDTGHFKPFWYYAGIIFSKDLFVFLDEFVGDFKSQRLYSMGPSEAILGLAILIPVLSVLVRPKSIWTGLRAGKYSFVLFSFVWTCLSFLVYSFVKYKTPWLIINITFPWILCLAAVLTHLCDRVGIFLFRIATTIVVLSSFAGFSWYYNFTLPYGEGNAYSYVHTSAGMLALTKDIEHYKEKSMSSRILVGVSGYWPLPFYLRGYKEFLGYVNTTDFDRYAKEYDILILDKSVRIEREGWARKYYRLTDAQESYTYFRRLEVDSDQVSFELE